MTGPPSRAATPAGPSLTPLHWRALLRFQGLRGVLHNQIWGWGEDWNTPRTFEIAADLFTAAAAVQPPYAVLIAPHSEPAKAPVQPGSPLFWLTALLGECILYGGELYLWRPSEEMADLRHGAAGWALFGLRTQHPASPATTADLGLARLRPQSRFPLWIQMHPALQVIRAWRAGESPLPQQRGGAAMMLLGERGLHGAQSVRPVPELVPLGHLMSQMPQQTT